MSFTAGDRVQVVGASIFRGRKGTVTTCPTPYQVYVLIDNKPYLDPRPLVFGVNEVKGIGDAKQTEQAESTD